MDDIKIGEILMPGEETDQEKRANKVRSRFWPVFRKALKQLPFARDIVAAYYCAMDPATPTRVRATLLAAFAYFVLPFDMVPDILALVGFGDDVVVLTAAIAMVRASMTAKHYAEADLALRQEGAND
jgi:uncharacterized membrane protein YkvA (DUF1232 family)